jgi:hypothetical protein
MPDRWHLLEWKAVSDLVGVQTLHRPFPSADAAANPFVFRSLATVCSKPFFSSAT